MGRTTTASVSLVLLLSIALGGCSSRPPRIAYHDPAMDFSLVKTVVVMPFGNLTQNQYAAGRVREVFMTLLRGTGSLYVVPPGEVSKALTRARVENPATPSGEEVAALAKALNADAVFTGSGLEYGELHSGTAAANVVTLGVKMMEAQSGKVVWTASSSKGGIGAGARLFGGGGEAMDIATQKVVEDLLDRLFRS